MSKARTTYEDYLKLAQKRALKFLMRPFEEPGSIDDKALWQCTVTGEVFSRSYHQVMSREYASPGQRHFQQYEARYHAAAARRGITFAYNPEHDYAPNNTKAPCKWRGPNGQIVVASYHQIAHGDPAHGDLPDYLRRQLGLTYAMP